MKSDVLPAPPESGPAAGRLSREARRRILDADGRPLFVCEWDRVVFVHYSVPPEALRPLVPFALDLADGLAWVSCVSFTLRNLRPHGAGPFAARLFDPVACQRYLNVRTYVRHGGEPGIFFLREWMDHRVSTWFVPPVYGLPYRYGRLDYDHRHGAGRIAGRVRGGPGSPGEWRYRANVVPDADLRPVVPGTLDEFLLERYVAFTERRDRRRLFRVWHEPWPQVPIPAEILDDRLLVETGPWTSRARFSGAHYSPGVKGVWMGRPRRCTQPAPSNH